MRFGTIRLLSPFSPHSRYVEDFVDMFAGRIYMDEPSRGLQAIHD